MSAETKKALDEAVAAHVTSETHGGTLTSYVCQTQYITVEMMDENSSGMLRISADNQNFLITLGLVHYAARQLDTDIDDVINLDDDE